MTEDDIESQKHGGSSSTPHNGIELPALGDASPSKAPGSPSGKQRPTKIFSLRLPSGSRSKSGDSLPQHRTSPSSTHKSGRSVTKAATMPPADEEAGPSNGTTISPSSTQSPRSPPLKSATVSPPLSPSHAEARTVFGRLGRPELETMDSYVVGARSPVISPGGMNIGRVPFALPSLPIFGGGEEADEGKRDTMRTPNRTRSRNRSRSRGPGSKRMSTHREGSTSDAAPRAPRRTKSGTRRDDDLPLPIATKAKVEAEDAEDNARAQDHDVSPLTDEKGNQPITQRLADLHERFPYLKQLQKPILPLVNFPGQGSGASSEFAQEAPLWSRQPYKLLYLAYFGLSIGLIFLPWFAFISLFRSQRPRQSWTWKRSTLVKLYRHGTRLTFRTHTQLSRDLTKEVPHNKTIRGKFVWVEALNDDVVRGDVRRMMELQGLAPRRTCGFWYGERDGGGGVGQKALPDERVVYHLHGGAYWIGTAHEKDVTAAVNMQVLKALDRISRWRGHAEKKVAEMCKRTFSVDYRLCVPGRPEVGSFPAPLLDALAGYRYLTRVCNFKPENIIVAGDSAGGNLGLALCRYLRDEKIDEMPGALILLSPWVDTSRSHSGPISAPNMFSSVWQNRKSDIISPSLAFRNTAVSALLGKMEARETYKNPYLSSCSLQLSPANGGAGPNWGYEGFPKRIYICTGTAELNHDQHLTLAYRLASGSQRRVPLFADGCDESCDNLDPFQMAARLDYPRPHDHEIMLWPSAQNTPAGTPVQPPQAGAKELQRESSRMSQDGDADAPELGGSQSGGVAGGANESQAPAQGHGDRKPAKTRRGSLGQISVEETQELADTQSPLNALHEADPHIGKSYSIPHSAQMSRTEAGSGDKSRKVKEKDTEANGEATKRTLANKAAKTDSDERGMQKSASATSRFTGMSRLSSRSNVYSGNGSQSNMASSIGLVDDGAQLTPHPLATSQRGIDGAADAGGSEDHAANNTDAASQAEPEYFAVGGEDRVVTLDVCKDAVHDYTLFNWFEPERGNTWARIAQWIDEQI